jgi:hypothetical protein
MLYVYGAWIVIELLVVASGKKRLLAFAALGRSLRKTR